MGLPVDVGIRGSGESLSKDRIGSVSEIQATLVNIESFVDHRSCKCALISAKRSIVRMTSAYYAHVCICPAVSHQVFKLYF